VPIELFQDVTAEVRTIVVPEGGELPPEEELEALAAAEEAAQAPTEEQKHELSLDELDAAALAQEAQLVAAGELQPSQADVDGELQEDEFDRAVDAGVTEEKG
jgi:imidazolonepropionase-like amidohydrolase